VACVSFWAFKVMVSGANNWQQLFLSATLLDAWVPSSTGDLMSKDPTWLVAALVFFYALFPAILQLTVAASKATLMNMMVVAWACTAVVPLAFVGFDLEVSWSMQHQVRTDALGYVAHCHRGCWSKQHRVMYMSY
jgi:hypothetical protein